MCSSDLNVCHYEEADRLMRAFTATWAPVRDALGPVAAAETGAGEAYDRFFDTGAAAFPAALRNEIGKDRVVAAAVAHRAAIRDERARLTTMRPAFLASIGVDVGHALDAADAEAHRRAGAAVAGRLHEEEAALGELLSQAAIIRFEIVDADRQRYWDPVLVTARFEQRGQFFWREPAARNYWAFNGEFWEDELGTYTYDVETRCPY